MNSVRALAVHGTFREAAEATNTSPASFSRHIIQAETYAGQQLFDRRKNGTQLTLAGVEFLRLLDVLHDASSVFETSVVKLRHPGTEMLNIGCGPLTTRSLIAPLLAEQLSQMPDLRVHIRVKANEEPLEDLRRGVIDVAVCDLTHTPGLSDLDIQVIKKRDVSFWARPEHPIHGRGPVNVADIFRQPFITAHIHRHWRAVIAQILGGDAAAMQIVDQLPQIECDDFAFLTDLACRQDLICAGIDDAFTQHAALGLLRQIPTVEALSWNICGARRKTGSFPALDMFWSNLIQEFGAE